MDVLLAATGITKSFINVGVRRTAVENVSLTLASKERLSIIGPSGCGKTTLLRVLAGMTAPDSGDVTWYRNGAAAFDIQLSFVPQSAAVIDSLTVQEHLDLPARMWGEQPSEQAFLAELVDILALEESRSTYAAYLSAGQRQVLGLAMLMQPRAEVVLLDEPFSALDQLSRQKALAALSAWLDRTHTSALLVTHSIPEAIFFGTRVLVFSARPMCTYFSFERPVRDGRVASFGDMDDEDVGLIRAIGGALHA